MNIWKDYLLASINGLEGFFHEYKYPALVIGVLMYAIFRRKCMLAEKEKKLILYTIGAVLLLLIPITGGVLLAYQTQFYDYGWIWSYVPLLTVLAWGAVTVIFEESGTTASATKRAVITIAGIGIAAAVLFLSGNLSKLQRVSEEELKQREAGEALLSYAEEQKLLQEGVIWGPKDIMQYLRSHDGEVILFYGRDMWDAKAGAYDYEVYTEEEIRCYQWMETVSSAHNLYLLDVEQASEDVYEALATDMYLREAVEKGVDLIILPARILDWMERKLQLIGEEKGLSVTVSVVGEYIISTFE